MFCLEAKFRLVDILKVIPITESTLHYWKRKVNEPDKEESIRTSIKKIWNNDCHYGVRRVYLMLRKQVEFSCVNHKKVQRIMHEMGLKGLFNIRGINSSN